MAYPASAYTINGDLWWDSTVWPGTRRRIGDEVRMAAWLAYNKSPGEYFTTDEIRNNVLEDSKRNEKEHFQRRLRELRTRDGWAIPSHKYSSTIPLGQYRLDVVGWHPGLGSPRPPKGGVSSRVRRLILERDGSRCQLCGVGRGEPYPADPERKAVMTVGHVVPLSYGGATSPDNLRAECSLCNEQTQAATGEPASFREFQQSFRNLPVKEKRKVEAWMAVGYRFRDAADLVFDKYRALSPADQELALEDVSHAGKDDPNA